MCIDVGYNCHHINTFFCGLKKCLRKIWMRELENCWECSGLRDAGYRDSKALDGLTVFKSEQTYFGFYLSHSGKEI